MKNKYASFPLTMAILAFICYLFIMFLMSTAVQPLWGRISVLLMPALVLGSIGLLALKGLFDSKITAVLTVVLSVIFLLVSLCYYIFSFHLDGDHRHGRREILSQSICAN